MEMFYLSGACISGLGLVLFATALILPLQGHGGNPKQSIKVLTILIAISIIILALTLPALFRM